MSTPKMSAPQKRPEAVNGLSMDVAPDVFATHLVHGGVRVAFLAQAGIQATFVSGDQINLLRDRFTDKELLALCDQLGRLKVRKVILLSNRDRQYRAQRDGVGLRYAWILTAVLCCADG